jgi:mitofusin
MRIDKDTSLPTTGGEKQLKIEDVQEAYIDQKDRLLGAIDTTKTILGGLREFNKNDWVVRYPTLQEQASDVSASSSNPKPRRSLRRSLSFADDPSNQTDIVYTPSRHALTRAVTLASISDAHENVSEATHESENDGTDEERLLSDKVGDFSILRLDLKLGPHGSSTAPAALVSQLEKGSIANLLDERIGAAIQHMDRLRLRVEDTSSKVLVTGDLNSGKSTFVNALLRREVMPVDQQPCTTAFSEVHDAAENNGVEEVHVLKEGIPYSISDESTFSRVSLTDLESIVADNESVQPVLKIYLADGRGVSESLLNNGVVDISLIDAPGLNRDSLKTTALFSRQEEIDVVVFVVSAENHFTLSSREFLENASNEKAYVFIVVNKFEQIKNKEKCRRLVLEQIQELSPRTYEDAQDLVHFVDSAAALRPYTANPAFDDLESSLRSFVLVKRSKSKLQPASTYLSNLLTDVDLLVGANAILAQADIDRAKDDLNRAKPVFEKMKSERESLEDTLEGVEEDGATSTAGTTKAILSAAIERVGLGQLGVDHSVTMPTFPGFLAIFDYARDVRKALLASLDAAVKLAENEARVTTTGGVKHITLLGDQHLPEGVERSRRVFMPEAMFSVRPGAKGGRSRPTANSVVAGGVYNLGIGLSQRPDILETSFLDLFDFNHHLSMHFGDGKAEAEEDQEKHATALSIFSVGVGALTMVGGKTIGVRGLIDGVVRVAELFADESARRWVAPVIGAVVFGTTAYFILELPNSIPRTIGRRIRASLVKVEDGATEQELFVNAHAGRVSRETRKVLRLASWDLRERFRTAMEERGKEVSNAEELEKKARKALQYFHEVESRTGVVRNEAGMAGAF